MLPREARHVLLHVGLDGVRQTSWLHRTYLGRGLAARQRQPSLKATYEQWVKKYGEDQAKYLLEEMSRWTNSYSNGTLISLDFVKHLKLQEQVRKICTERGWQYAEIGGRHGDVP